MIDTGIDFMHPALGGGYGPGFKVAGGYDFVNGDDDPIDDQGHGTHVAGTIAASAHGLIGVAPEATLYAYKVLSETGGSDARKPFRRAQGRSASRSAAHARNSRGEIRIDGNGPDGADSHVAAGR